jgi:hypothetical protein
MKKLHKTITLSTQFQKWYALNSTHKYDSSANKFYSDLFYELLIIQEGLCAYTEFRIVEESKLFELKNGFVNGKYTNTYSPSIPGQIEHFSKSKKQSNGWDWDNLFVVFDKVNHAKNKLEDQYGIHDILKPDTLSYSPDTYLSYDAAEHIFYPNNTLDKTTSDKVFSMILVLGLNNDFIKMERREYLETIKFKEEFSEMKQTIHQFHTAYSMLRY